MNRVSQMPRWALVAIIIAILLIALLLVLIFTGALSIPSQGTAGQDPDSAPDQAGDLGSGLGTGTDSDSSTYLGDPPSPEDIQGVDYIQAFIIEPEAGELVAVQDTGNGQMTVAYSLEIPIPKGTYSGTLIAGDEKTDGYQCVTDDDNAYLIKCSGSAPAPGVEFSFEIYKDVQLPPGDEDPLDYYLAGFPIVLLSQDFTDVTMASQELGIPFDVIGVPQAWDIVAYCLNFLETSETIPNGCYKIIINYYDLDAVWFSEIVPETDLCLAMFNAGMDITEECARHLLEIGAVGEDFWKGIVPEVHVGLPGEGREQIYLPQVEEALFSKAEECAEALAGADVNAYDLDSWEELRSFFYFLNGMFRPDDSCHGLLECVGDAILDAGQWLSDKLRSFNEGLYTLFTDPVGFWSDYIIVSGDMSADDWAALFEGGAPQACQDFLDLADQTYLNSNKYGIADACAISIGYNRWDYQTDWDWPDDLYYYIDEAYGDDYSGLTDACILLMQHCDTNPGFGCFQSGHYGEGGFPPGFDPFGFTSVTDTDALCEEARAAGEDSMWCEEPDSSSNPFLSSTAACAEDLGWPGEIDSYMSYLNFATFLSLNTPWLAEDWPSEACQATVESLGDSNPDNLPMSSFGENQTKNVLFVVTGTAVFIPRPTPTPLPTAIPTSTITGTVKSDTGTGLPGFTITVAHGSCGGIAIIAAQTTSGAGGSYTVGGLDPGPYCVSVNKFGGWEYYNPATGYTPIVTTPGGTSVVNFALVLN